MRRFGRIAVRQGARKEPARSLVDHPDRFQGSDSDLNDYGKGKQKLLVPLLLFRDHGAIFYAKWGIFGFNGNWIGRDNKIAASRTAL